MAEVGVREPSSRTLVGERADLSAHPAFDWLRSIRLAVVPAVVAGVVAGAMASAYAQNRRPSYRAQVVLATVGAARPAIGGGIAANLLSNSLGSAGIQPTAVFIAKIAKLPNVLRAVLHTRLSGGSARTIAEALPHQPEVEDRAIERLSRVIGIAVDERTGILTVSVVSQDSILARGVVASSVSNIRKAFLDASRAQAEAQRDAQSNRVDRALQRLTEAERALFEFRAANRAVPETSPLSLTMHGLEREASLAESLYSQAVGEREAATAKVLEQTPSLIEIDTLPATLPTEPRYTLIVAVTVTVLVSLFVLTWLLSRRALRERGMPLAVR